MVKQILFFLGAGILILLVIIIGFLGSKSKEEQNLSGELATLRSLNPTGKEKVYSKTVAICNGSNFCQDYRIICKNGEFIEKTAIENATVQHPLGWKDTRNINYENLCA